VGHHERFGHFNEDVLVLCHILLPWGVKGVELRIFGNIRQLHGGSASVDRVLSGQ
jgi:hypothetical protein